MSPNLVRQAKFLSVFTITYNLIEGLVSIYLGLEGDALSLIGFGGDSFIEVASAVIVLLKLQQTDPDKNLSAERRSTFMIGVLFLLLSLSVFLTSTIELWQSTHPQTTLPGVIISCLSLSFMFSLWRAKRKVGEALGSATVLADAQCSLACIKLSGVLFIGSILFLLIPGLWWIDSLAAVIIAIFIGLEGWELIQSSRKTDFKGGCCTH